MDINYELYDLFLENDEVKSGISQMIIEFEHMIKFEVCKHNQDTDWIKSILVASRFLKKLSKSDTNKIKDQIDACYMKGRKQAYQNLTSGSHPYKWFTDISTPDRPSDWTYELISSENNMMKWMQEHAYSDNVRNRLNVQNMLSDKDKSKMIANYTPNKAFPGIK